jgi:phosphoribosyl 1,2-cyclic phosphodiesterase
MPLSAQILGSSSGGNCTLIWQGRKALLVDFGFGPRFIEEGLAGQGLGWQDLAGVLVTHTHGDHVDPFTMKKMANEHIPVIAPSSVIHSLKKRLGGSRAAVGGIFEPLPKSGGREAGPFQIAAFEVPHDAPGGCFGYRVRVRGEGGERQIAIATDLGFADNGLPMEFAGSDLLVVESNHDPDMLENSGRPEWLKQRIRDLGHLSNPQAVDLVGRILALSGTPPAALLLAHLSQECNTEPVALRTMKNGLAGHGHSALRVEVSHPLSPSAVASVF